MSAEFGENGAGEDTRSLIENIMCGIAHDFAQGRVGGAIVMVRRTHGNASERGPTGALVLGEQVTQRVLNARSALSMARLFQVLAIIHELLSTNRRVSQRELYYLLIHLFSSQPQCNATIQDASATLGVPRYALNIGAATRGVVAGSLRIATASSSYHVDCEHVGMVS